MSKPDLSEFEKLSKPRRAPCPIPTAVAELPPDEAKQLEAALATGKEIITAKAIAEWLEARGIKVTWQRIASHRNGGCLCDG